MRNTDRSNDDEQSYEQAGIRIGNSNETYMGGGGAGTWTYLTTLSCHIVSKSAWSLLILQIRQCTQVSLICLSLTELPVKSRLTRRYPTPKKKPQSRPTGPRLRPWPHYRIGWQHTKPLLSEILFARVCPQLHGCHAHSCVLIRSSLTTHWKQPPILLKVSIISTYPDFANHNFPAHRLV